MCVGGYLVKQNDILSSNTHLIRSSAGKGLTVTILNSLSSTSGAGCSKLKTSLVNVSLNFQT